MKKVGLITDTNSGITLNEGKELGIKVISMPVIIDGEEYYEDENLTHPQFYDFLSKDANVSTSQPSQFTLEEIWTEMLKEYDELVYIPMTSGLSATCSNASRYAEGFDGKVYVVDNRRISVMQKESVYEALELIKCGKSAKDIKETLEKDKDMSVCYIYVSTLKYLK